MWAGVSFPCKTKAELLGQSGWCCGMLPGRDLGDRPWSFNPGLLEIAGTWGQVRVLAASAVGCTGAMAVLGPPEGREVTSGQVAGGMASDTCYKKGRYAQLGVYPLLAQRRLDARQHQDFGG